MNQNLFKTYKITFTSVIGLLLGLGLIIRFLYLPLAIIGTIFTIGLYLYIRKNQIKISPKDQIIVRILTIIIILYALFLSVLFPFRITWYLMIGLAVSALIDDESTKWHIYQDTIFIYMIFAALMLNSWYLILSIPYSVLIIYNRHTFIKHAQLIESVVMGVCTLIVLGIIVYWIFLLPIIIIGSAVYLSELYTDILFIFKDQKRKLTLPILYIFLLSGLTSLSQLSINNSKGIPRTTHEYFQTVAIHKDYYIYDRTSSDNLDTEHVLAKNGDSAGYYNDLHNLYLANKTINQQRGNKIIGNKTGQFEPADAYKGNVARVLLYMYVTYPEVRKSHMIDIELMKQWNLLDPPDAGEKRRNDAIDSYGTGENGRNIFIDHYWIAIFVK